MSALHDMHCHLDFMTNAEEVASDAAASKSLLFANTVTPDGWLASRRRFGNHDNVAVGFGAHPWWACDKEYAVELLEQHRPLLIGEVGLDLGKRHASTAPEQVEVFTAIARWAAGQGGRLLSVHSVKAAKDTLDILQDTGALNNCTCIFHWFTGPSDQLKRAIDAGCYFSAGRRMLATGKGREYVKAIPASRLLLESDDPPCEGEPYSFEALRGNLEAAAMGISQIKGDETIASIASTSRHLLEIAGGASS